MNEAERLRLLGKVEELEKRPLEGKTIQEKIYAAYQAKVLEELKPLLKKNHQSPSDLKELQSFLEKKGTSLSYTAYPNDKLTHLLCEIAEYIKANDEAAPCALKILMPKVETEAYYAFDYPSLKTLDIKEVLKTHILGRDGTYLIPVQQFLELQQQVEAEWLQIYYDHDVRINPADEQARLKAFVNAEEYERLANHSPYTKALVEAKKQYELSTQAGDNLLKRLKDLCACLFFNSEQGVGTGDMAGSGAYDGIIQFNDYYFNLDENEKKKIPQAVKDKIDEFVAISSNKDANNGKIPNQQNAQAAPQEPQVVLRAPQNVPQGPTIPHVVTCIDTNRKKLEEVIKPNEEVLGQIGLSDEIKKKLIEEKAEYVKKCQQEFAQAIKTGRYEGIDSPSINLEFIAKLGIDIIISSFEDLTFLTKLKPEELTSLCQSDSIQQQIIAQFDNLDSLIFFIHQTSPSALRILFKACGEALREKFIGSPKDLAALLISFDKDKERSQIVVEAMEDYLLRNITSVWNFHDVLEHLSVEQCRLLIEVIKEQLPQIIKNAIDFSGVLAPYSLEQRSFIFEAMKDNLSEIFKDGWELGQIFRFLTEEQRKVIIDKLELPRIIKDGKEFGQALKPLSAAQRSFVFEAMKDKLSEFIENGQDLGQVLRFLTEEQCKVIIDKLELPRIIENSKEFGQALKHLSVEQRDLIFEAMKDQLSQFISRANDFGPVLNRLSEKQRSFVFNKIEANLPQMFLSPTEFGQTLQYFSLEECRSVIKTMKGQLSEIIINSSDLGQALKPLSIEQSVIVIEAMKAQLPNIIKSSWDFCNVLQWLSPEKGDLVFEAMKEQLPSLITRERDLGGVFQYLSPEKWQPFLNSIKLKLPTLVENLSQFNLATRYLDERQRLVLCKNMPFLHRLIRNVQVDFPKMNTQFETEEGKKQFQGYFLNSLLTDIKSHGKDSDVELNKLCENLRQQADEYFSKKINPIQFQKNCNELIDNAIKPHLRSQATWGKLLEKLVLAIATLGTAVAYSCIKTIVETGKWNCNFFTEPREVATEKLKSSIVEMKSIGMGSVQVNA